jgi:hypothetical protein
MSYGVPTKYTLIDAGYDYTSPGYTQKLLDGAYTERIVYSCGYNGFITILYGAVLCTTI